MPDRQTPRQASQRAPAARHRSVAWEDGYVAAMAGLGDLCSCPPASIQVIEWDDGYSQAAVTLRLLLDS